MDTIKFGASVSTSGRYALQGSQALAGLRSWARDTNANGGVKLPGRSHAARVNLVLYDDASSSSSAGVNTEKLISDDRVDVLIGPYGSDLTRAVVGVAQPHGKVVWNQGGASDDIHRPGSHVIGVLTPVSRYLSGLLYMMKTIEPDDRRVAVVYRRGSGFGRAAADGVEVMAPDEFAITRVTYSPNEHLPRLLARLRKDPVHVILSAGAFNDEYALARQLAGSGSKANLGFVAAGLAEFGQALGRDAQGIFGPSQWEPGVNYAADFGPSSRDIEQSIKNSGAAPDYPAAQAYAACLIAQRCVESAPGTEHEVVWQTACSLDCTTFFGRFRVDFGTGLQVGKEMLWVQWQDGHKKVVWPTDVAESRPVQTKGAA